MIVLYILLAIVLLLLMVLIHEFGHYVAGRALGFKIEEFSVGFGKALISKKNKRGEKISLRLFPLGGYCAFAGEEDEKASSGSFTAQAPWKRIIVFLAGVTFNFLTAIIFSVILLCAVGYDIPQVRVYEDYNTSMTYQIDNKTYYYKIDDSSLPNEFKMDSATPWNTRLQEGDVVFAINGTHIDFAYSATFNDLISGQYKALAIWLRDSTPEKPQTLDNFGVNGNGSMTFTVRRDGEYMDVQVPLIYSTMTEDEAGTVVAVDKDGNPRHIFSIGFSSQAYKHTFWEALSRCISFAFGLAWVVLKSLWMLITFQIPISQIGGPVTTISTIASFAQQNFASILVLIPLLSANLAVFNALPFPALDGSHVVFTTIEWIRRKPINRKIENIIHMVGLGILFGFVIIVDILHFVL